MDFTKPVSLPSVEIMELLGKMAPTAALPAQVTVCENLHLYFDVDTLWGTLIKGGIIHRHSLPYMTPDEWEGKSILLSFDLVSRLIKSATEHCELFYREFTSDQSVHGQLTFVEGKTKGNFALDDSRTFPKIPELPDTPVWEIEKEALLTLLQCRIFAPTDGLDKENVERILLSVEEDQTFRAYAYAFQCLFSISGMGSVGVTPKQSWITLHSDTAALLEKILEKSRDQYIYFYYRDEKTYIEGEDWYISDCFLPVELHKSLGLFRQFTAPSPEVHTQRIVLTKNDLKKALTQWDTVGYDTDALKRSEKTFVIKKEAQSPDVFLPNDLTAHGAKALIHLPCRYEFNGSLTQFKKRFSTGPVLAFLRTCPDMPIYFYPGDRPETAGLLLCSNRQLVLVPYQV